MREVTASRTAETTSLAEVVPATIDVRTIIPNERHEQIFAAFKALPEGAAFELVNDHDPVPLNRQFKSSFHGQFTWDYLEQGPEIWRVRIAKNPGNCCGSCS